MKTARGGTTTGVEKGAPSKDNESGSKQRRVGKEAGRGRRAANEAKEGREAGAVQNGWDQQPRRVRRNKAAKQKSPKGGGPVKDREPRIEKGRRKEKSQTHSKGRRHRKTDDERRR